MKIKVSFEVQIDLPSWSKAILIGLRLSALLLEAIYIVLHLLGL